MSTPMPASPFLSAEVTSSPAVAVALVRSHRIESATAEISPADVVMPSAAAASTSEPGAAEPAVAIQPPAIAGANSASVRDRIELQEIQGSDGLRQDEHMPASRTGPSEAFIAAGGPQEAPAADANPNPHEPAGALGTIPLDYETILKALESCLHEDWIFGIDEPEPPIFIETFKLGEVA